MEGRNIGAARHGAGDGGDFFPWCLNILIVWRQLCGDSLVLNGVKIGVLVLVFSHWQIQTSCLMKFDVCVKLSRNGVAGWTRWAADQC